MNRVHNGFLCFCRLQRDKERLNSEHDRVKNELANLEERHQRFIIQYGHEGSETQRGMPLKFCMGLKLCQLYFSYFVMHSL